MNRCLHRRPTVARHSCSGRTTPHCTITRRTTYTKIKNGLRYSARALRDALPCGAEARFLLRDTSCQPGWQRVCREWADGGQWKTIDSRSKDDGGVCWQATVAEHRTPPRTSVRRHRREKVAYIAEQVHGRGDRTLDNRAVPSAGQR